MSTRVNYASTNTDADTAAAFEAALEKGRTAGGTLAHLIGGREVNTGEVFARVNPAHPGEIVTEAHAGDESVVAAAVVAAKQAQRDWRRTSTVKRAEGLRAAQREFQDRLVEIAGIVSAETGKSRLEALGEAQEVVDLVDTYTTQFEESGDFRKRMKTADPKEENTDLLRPYGVFAVIGPFNFPAALNVGMATAALLMGNTVVMKPSDKAPRSGATVAEILARHLPSGAVNLIHGGATTGKALADAAVDGIAFTGSAEIGWQMVRALSDGPFGRPVLAEMGGKNVTVVSRHADLDAAAEGVVRSAYGLSGQKCSACSRVVVEESVHDEFVAKLAERVNALTVSAPEDADAFMGPVIDEAAVARFEKAVASAQADGASIDAGGDRPDRDGYFVNPTVVSGLPLGHELTRKELFLPFVTVTKVDSFDAAIDEANAVDYGLAAGVFSADDTEVEEFLDRIEAGVLYVNRRTGATTGAWPGIQSFCGWKSSGSAGKGGLGPWYLPGFAREQSRTLPVAK
ncbi:aldehyde dehydrogenase family protein [Mycolicibacterium goodii]|uniref:aldehyde dehydrogenase family protein n=1 Tax=Mycolicibacterium goodii TaxID=134601 RepID=UPI001F04F8D0|nr:aldehyde dehydrogenase family protein [Mycolicibacterium goodii]ULN48252.1 aldehyde dehydrogenase family protein [Mycolicibacterium goodii]